MANRSYVGPVIGGRQTEPVWIEKQRGPVELDAFAIEKHAQGRTTTMVEILHHCIY